MSVSLVTMKKYVSLPALPLSIFFLLVTLPTLMLPSDVWDGVLIEYASEIRDYTGLKSWFFESTWYLQYYFVSSLIRLSESFGVSYKNLNAITALIIMAILLREVFIFSERLVGLNKFFAQLAVIFAATFPALSSLLSSVLTFHLCCTAVGLLGIRAINESSLKKKILGIIAVFLAYSLQSQLIFLPILSYVYDIGKNRLSRNFFPYPSTETLLTLLLAGVFYLYIKLISPTTGIFETYQTFIIGSLAGIPPFILRGLHYLTYLIPIAATTFLYVVLVDTFREKSKNIFEFTRDVEKYPRYILLWVLILLFAGAFPYMAVGKSSILWDINDWNGRQAFLLILPLSVLVSLLLQRLHESADKKIFKNLIIAIGCFVLAINFSLLLCGVFAKHSRQNFLTRLQEIIRSKESKLPPGLLQIVVKDIPPTVFEFYEPNFVMYKATGNSHWWTRIGDRAEPTFLIPCFIAKNTVYQKQFIYQPGSADVMNHTVLTIQANGFSGLTNMIKNSFNINKQFSMKVVSLQSVRLTDLPSSETCR